MVRSTQPLCSGISNAGKSKSLNDSSSHNAFNDENSDDTGPSCPICGKKGHKSYISPYTNTAKVSYFACETFIKMTPAERRKRLEIKGLCGICLNSGAKAGHDENKCNKRYACPNSEYTNGAMDTIHVMLCDPHKGSTENTELLKKFKQEVIRRYNLAPCELTGIQR